jgi:hypothetical protein
MNTHCFNIELAKKYGVEEAILFNHIYFWIEKNKANKKHFYEGNYWTYNSVRAFSDLFPYWSAKQIDRILKSLINQNVLLTGNFNKAGYDKTKWYAINPLLSLILPNGEMDLTKQGNGFNQTGKPIPDTITDNKTDINVNYEKLLEFFNKVTGRKHRTITEDAKKRFKQILEVGYTKQDICNAIENCFNNEYHQKHRHFLTLDFISKMVNFQKYVDSNPKNNTKENYDENMAKRAKENFERGMTKERILEVYSYDIDTDKFTINLKPW